MATTASRITGTTVASVARANDGEEWAKIQARYGSMKRLQTLGKG